MPVVQRRNVVRGLTWTAPAVAITTAAPALAASANKCMPSVTADGSVYYNWGVLATSPTTTATTAQDFTMYGAVGANTLPADAVITSIWFEYWIQQRDDAAKNADGSSGAHGPGVYDPGNSKASTASTCKISYSTITSCTYKGTAPPLSNPNAGTASSIFTAGKSSAGVTEAWVDHAFKKLDGSTVTTKAWQFTFTGDPALANSLLTKDATGCLNLALALTPRFNVSYKNVLQAGAAERTIYIDRTAYITYTSGGQTKTLSRYLPNTLTCNSSGQPGGVNRC